MGLYDYIKCEMPLPETELPPPAGEAFQTKDTPDQYMTWYTITADGRLSWRPYEFVDVPKEERPYPNDDGLLGLMGALRRVEQDAVFLDFHGDIDFGTISTHRGQYSGGEWDYRARFTEGVCAKIALVAYSPPSEEKIAAIEANWRARYTASAA